MPITIKPIQTLDIQLPVEPGALAKVYSAFREAKVNVVASWGYEAGPKEAFAHILVTDVKPARAVLDKMGFKTKVSDAVWAEGDDRVGQYAEVLGKVAKAGVNLTATDAFAIEGRFASVLFTAPQDFPKLRKALSI